MMSAAEPPELLPIAARPSGSLVSFTSQFFSTRGSTSASMYVGVVAVHVVVFLAALVPLGVAAAVGDRR